MEGQRAENGLLKNKKGGDEMPKRYKKARLMHKAKLTEMAAKLGVSQPTLSAWESERKSTPVEAVIKMATLYGVTTDYLLGLDDTVSVMPGQPFRYNA